ncbi:hypothetical protein, partial [Shigella sonnei]|uniref:hypothetical protein n=1 Tax=Shigella sonnei TaxID=624 RepID=UPI001C0A799C
TGGTADRNRSHWSTSKTPSYTKSVSWQHHRHGFKFASVLGEIAADFAQDKKSDFDLTPFRLSRFQ